MSAAKITALVLVVAALGALAWFGYQKTREPAVVEQPEAVEELTLTQFSDKVLASTQVVLLDVRPKTDYAAEHIPDSVAMPSYEIGARLDEIKLFSDWEVILITSSDADEASTQLAQASRDLTQAGFTKLYSLQGGYNTYKDADLSVVSQATLVQEDLANVLGSLEVPELSVAELKKRLDSDAAAVALIDGRTSFEFVTGFIPGAINIPLHTVGASVDRGFIPRDKTVVFYDRVGNRAKIAVQALLDAGYENVFNLTGGIEAWVAADGETALPKEDGSDLPELIPVLYPEE